MANIISAYKRSFSNKKLVQSVIIGFLLLGTSIVVNHIASIYATNRQSSYVTDLILSNVPTIQVDLIFAYGSVIIALGIIFLVLRHPKLLPFTLKSVSIFVIIRAVFMSLTHLGASPIRIPLDANYILSKITFGGDLFFSGHTGLPFLMALLFWDNKHLRYIFFASSLILGASALLGHFHYSIDVFGAFFITYSIFHIAKYFFPGDYKLFKETVLEM